MTRRHGRRRAPRIIDPATHQPHQVGLRVAAEFLALDERTVRARIESGDLAATRDGKAYRIDVGVLAQYVADRRSRST